MIQTILQIVLALAFGVGAGLFFWRFYLSLKSGDELRLDYHWGGLGGGLGGWRISTSFAYLLVAFGLGGLLAVAVVSLKPAGEPEANKTTGQNVTAAPSTTTAQGKTVASKVGEQGTSGQKSPDEKAIEANNGTQKAADNKAAEEKKGEQKTSEKSADQKSSKQ